MGAPKLTRAQRDLLQRVCASNGGGVERRPGRDFERLLKLGLVQPKKCARWVAVSSGLYVHTAAGKALAVELAKGGA